MLLEPVPEALDAVALSMAIPVREVGRVFSLLLGNDGALAAAAWRVTCRMAGIEAATPSRPSVSASHGSLVADHAKSASDISSQQVP